MFCIDKCRPKITGVDLDQIGDVAFDDAESSERAKQFQCYSCCFDMMTLQHPESASTPATQQKMPPFRYVFQPQSVSKGTTQHDMQYCNLCMKKSPWVTYTVKPLSVNANSGELVFEQADQQEDFEDIGMDEQVIQKCLGTPSQSPGASSAPNEATDYEECCQAYKIIKSEGVECGTCKRTTKEVWFRTDDDAKCAECFEQKEIDKIMLS